MGRAAGVRRAAQEHQPRAHRQNADLFSFSLDDQDMASIAQMDRGTAVAWAIGDPTTLA